jgi:hypothetical protein
MAAIEEEAGINCSALSVKLDEIYEDVFFGMKSTTAATTTTRQVKYTAGDLLVSTTTSGRGQ